MDEDQPHLCDGIRAMKGITNHSDWWIVLSLHGFGSHLVGKSLKEFSKRKILVIKEEGDTAQVSQAYDQLVAILSQVRSQSQHGI